MRVLIDGDAFPDLDEVVKLCCKYQKKVIVYVDYSHEISLDVDVRYISSGSNAVDTAIENEVKRGDLLLTQDYGVATVGLSRGAFCIHPLGYLYTEENILSLLMRKHQSDRLRKHLSLKGPKKRTREDTKRLLSRIEKEFLR